MRSKNVSIRKIKQIDEGCDNIFHFMKVEFYHRSSKGQTIIYWNDMIIP